VTGAARFLANPGHWRQTLTAPARCPGDLLRWFSGEPSQPLAGNGTLGVSDRHRLAPRRRQPALTSLAPLVY
jgi:hypothetical protein